MLFPKMIQSPQMPSAKIAKPFRLISTKTWLAVASTSKPPSSEMPMARQLSRQLRTTLSFSTWTSVIDPTQLLTPGLINSCCRHWTTSSAVRSWSVLDTLLLSTPHAWSSPSWVCDLRKNWSDARRSLRRLMSWLKYFRLCWFFSSRTVLSPWIT